MLMPMHSPAHPGVIIREYLGEMTVGDGAEHIGLSRPHFSQVLNGHSDVTADLAVRLERVFPYTNGEFWMTLQVNYDLAKARKKAKPKVKVIAKSKPN